MLNQYTACSQMGFKLHMQVSKQAEVKTSLSKKLLDKVITRCKQAGGLPTYVPYEQWFLHYTSIIHSVASAGETTGCRVNICDLHDQSFLLHCMAKCKAIGQCHLF